MTLEQLKSLRVGDIVRYTNKEDASNTYVTKVSSVLDWQIELYDGVAYTPISFFDQDIEHIASTLAIVSSNNELQIILHQIRDCEFDMMQLNIKSAPLRLDFRKDSEYQSHKDMMDYYGFKLQELRNKRDNLLKQNI
jgi:hypothetical protein